MDERLIAGLGNIGLEYEGTRHNVGFEAIDLLAKRLKIKLNKEKFSAAFGQAEFEDKKLILLKPLLFMNNSGQVVATAANFYKIAAGKILVIADDMALEPGMIRLRASGSAGGHNGLADIIEKLGTDQFNRLRVGIGIRNEMTGRDYVLSRPDETERKLIDKAIAEATEAVMVWISEGIESAMSRFNRKLPADKNEESEK
ncbi:MAG: aminoacyl-tRNA hydrolase [Sedimentisphaerales bacterium]